MKIKVLGASGGEAPGEQLTAFLIDDDILLDAGTAGAKLTVSEQRKIRHVLLTHAHLDHIHALPFLLDNCIGRIAGPVVVYGHAEVIEALQKHIFNNRIWPDFSVLPTEDGPILQYRIVEGNRPFQVGEYTVEPVLVSHSFVAFAYIISNTGGSVVFTGDTGPVQELWAKVAVLPKVHAVFMECSFSNRAQDLAKMTSHLCTADVGGEMSKTGREQDVPVYLYHLKPEYAEEIRREAEALNPLRAQVACSGDEHLFP
ncbi:3',5'-cyclic-nucleotide phosphodiesterase [candidate division FCPU426 bacterium]|nr:3',5'-cyclic-nucleotide phosphodiesterase [candidate division FCPU426 bacterium]